jgi:hypothetical protein
MQQVEVIYYQCFGTTNWSHLQGSRIQKKGFSPNMETRMKDHHQYIWLGHPDKSVVAEHRFNRNHLIKIPRHPDRLYCMDLSGCWLTWSFILTIRIGRVAQLLVGHGNLSFAPLDSVAAPSVAMTNLWLF